MCIRDRLKVFHKNEVQCSDRIHEEDIDVLVPVHLFPGGMRCLLYTSDAADERSSVDLGGRRIIKKKNNGRTTWDEEHDVNNSNKSRLRLYQ